MLSEAEINKIVAPFPTDRMAGLRAVEAAVRADHEQSIIEAEVRGGVEYLQANQELAYELAAAQAVIAEVRDSARSGLAECDDDCDMSAFEVHHILSQSPTDALQAVKAKAWDEGYGDDMECHVPRINPYRAATSTPELEADRG